MIEREIPATPDLDAEGRLVLITRIEDASAKLKENPASYPDWIDLGQLRLIAGDLEGASEAWEYAALIGPNTVAPFHNLGDLYAYRLKDYPKAELNFKKALENEPDNPYRYRVLFEMYATWKPQGPEAAQALQDGIEAFPKALDLHVLLARHYRDTGKTSEARATYDAALVVARSENNPSAITQLESEKAAVR